MKKIKKIGLCYFTAMLLLIMLLPVCNVQAASQKANEKNTVKVLTYLKKGKYREALQYNRKLDKTAKEECTKKMSKKMKKAYLKIVKRYPVGRSYGETVLWNYYLTNLDNDNSAELIIEIGSCEGDKRLVVYKYKKGKVKKIGSIDAIHSSYSAYVNHKGIIEEFGMHGYNTISIISIKGKKLVRRELCSTDIASFGGNWFQMRCQLKSHLKGSGSYTWMDYSDLK